MNAAYVNTYHIYTEEEMLRFEKEGELVPSWEQGKEKHRFVAMLDFHVAGLADQTQLSDGWRLVEPMHVLPKLWGCGIGKKLWQKCVEAAARVGAPGLRVWSLDRNEQANQFYRGRGCTPLDNGTLTLIAHPELGITAHIEKATGYVYRLKP
jgi:GNAT superfamily N-acetyltransferase